MAAVCRAFKTSRLIVVPGSTAIKFLSIEEAFWSVAPELLGTQAEAWALEKHYPLYKTPFDGARSI